jgi:hypothetical protein
MPSEKYLNTTTLSNTTPPQRHPKQQHHFTMPRFTSAQIICNTKIQSNISQKRHSTPQQVLTYANEYLFKLTRTQPCHTAMPLPHYRATRASCQVLTYANIIAFNSHATPQYHMHITQQLKHHVKS